MWGGLVTYTVDQDTINTWPCITFGQLHAKAKSTHTDLRVTFKGDVPVDVLERIALPQYSANVCPYTVLIEWYGMVGTKPCSCGCMARVPKGQRFHCSTCKVRYEIMRERKPPEKEKKRRNASRQVLVNKQSR